MFRDRFSTERTLLLTTHPHSLELRGWPLVHVVLHDPPRGVVPVFAPAGSCLVSPFDCLKASLAACCSDTAFLPLLATQKPRLNSLSLLPRPCHLDGATSSDRLAANGNNKHSWEETHSRVRGKTTVSNDLSSMGASNRTIHPSEISQRASQTSAPR